ncbi:TIGR02594 family protein [Sphingomonas sp. Leaf412]|uniref:TIGR02594 family protein n=1 Tax=Sphingomonas sp. Leaf412 TaxID=1736370 RepID=UPI000AFF44D1|nr:TIGR02594 family protein [Sphingomonas sp. Leaf412]
MPIDTKNYKWLDKLGTLPRMIAEARKLIDTYEHSGATNNPVIMDWAKEVDPGGSDGYTADSIPWCGLFMAVVARRAGKTPPVKPYWALNWGKFGVDGGQPELGDVLTFIRTAADGSRGGHVALYVGEDASCYHVLGETRPTGCVSSGRRRTASSRSASRRI